MIFVLTQERREGLLAAATGPRPIPLRSVGSISLIERSLPMTRACLLQPKSREFTFQVVLEPFGGDADPLVSRGLEDGNAKTVLGHLG